MYIGCYIKTLKAMSRETYLFFFHDINVQSPDKLTQMSDFYDYDYYTDDTQPPSCLLLCDG